MIPYLRAVSSDLRGLARLAVEGTVGVTDLVESMHEGIQHPLSAGKPRHAVGGRGLSGLVYGTIRALTRTVGLGVEAALAPLDTLEGAPLPSPQRETLLAALNGVLGDHLAATGNPLATPMRLYHAGLPLVLEAAALRAALPKPGTHLLVLIHGLCHNERQWGQSGFDHGVALARDLGCTVLYLRYNTGLHISTNGKALADLLETLLTQWPEPVARLDLLAHSMGGLVARSACHQAQVAGLAWPATLRHLVFLGTPHHGAPLERWGHWFERVLEASPFASPLARLGKVRSAGITDLRYGNLLEADWQGQDPHAEGKDRRVPVPLPAGVRCCAVAGTAGADADSWKGRLWGDGLVSVDSALGRHPDPQHDLAFPENQTWTGQGLGHLDLLTRPEVYAQVRRWLEGAGTG
ncbi:MAG: hypothetical protein WCL47_09375 [Holophagaceae bacterium]